MKKKHGNQQNTTIISKWVWLCDKSHFSQWIVFSLYVLFIWTVICDKMGNAKKCEAYL